MNAGVVDMPFLIAKSSTPSTNPVIVLAAAQALACICTLICGTAS
nr:hypothetical protein [Paenibacillus sonchi]